MNLTILVTLFFYLTAQACLGESFQLKIGKMFAQGQSVEIEKALVEEIGKEPSQTGLWLELADLRKSQGDYDGAAAAYENYLAQKDEWKVRVALAIVLEQKGQFLNARKSLEDLKAQHPEDPEILWGLARLCLYQAKWKSIRTQTSSRNALKEAQGYLLTLTSQKSENALATWQLAEVSRNLKDWDQALAAYQKVLQQDASYKKAHQYMAEILARQGQLQKALAQYDQAMAIDPENQDLKREARQVSQQAPREAQANEQQTQKTWQQWVPRVETFIGFSPVTIRVGIFTQMDRLLFRGESDLRILTPAQTPITLLKAGEDYQVTSYRARQGKGEKSWALRNKWGKKLVTFNERLWIVPVDPLKPFLVHAVPSNRGYFYAKQEDRAYRGILELSPRGDRGFNVINRVTLEDYTAGVLPAEMVSSWPMEALKAQAIVARTYVLSKMGHYNSEGFDVGDSVQDQVYAGLRVESKKSDEAVRETAGLVLKHQGKLMPVAFSAECGGHTQDYREAWGYPAPVVGVADYDSKYNQDLEFPLSPARLESWIKEDREAWCRVYGLRGYQNYRWTALVSAQSLQAQAPDIGMIRRLVVTHRSSAGWADHILVEGDQGHREYKGDIIRRFLGGIRSNLIWIEPQYNPQGWPEEFLIYGGGWGHGVGMCQVGCYGLAKAGKTCEEILKHYFPEGNICKMESPKYLEP